MKKFLCTLTILLLNFSLLHATPINKLYVFGDSLEDNGNLYHATAFTAPTPPYYQDRFSNSFVSSELLADNLGLIVSHYENLAFDSAMTSQKNIATSLCH